MQTTATARIPSSYASLEVAREGVQIGGAQDGAVGGDAFVDLDDAFVERLGQFDLAGEDPRAVLIGDPQRVAEAAGDDESGALALALQQGVGGDGGAHADGLHR